MAEPKRKATYDDVLAAPEHKVAEILDGELFLSPRPAFPHANATCDVAPDWVCETLSPSSAPIDRGRKLRIYARAGVAHVWLLDPLVQTLEILALGGDGLWIVTGVHTGSDKLRGEPFTALELDLAHLWLD